jgi:RNA polymerase sigma-70 factor (ECF subfamily)
VDRSAQNARDQRLVDQARAGRLEAFNELVVAYQDYLYSMTVRVVRDPDVAEEAVQEAFFSAYRNLDRFSGSSFRAWLTRISVNAAHDILRKRKRRPAEPYPEWEDEAWQPPAPPREGPEAVSMASFQRAAIARCMEGITTEQRTAIVLYDVEGYDYAEIAAITGVSNGTVKSRIHRGRLALRECLAPELEPHRG